MAEPMSPRAAALEAAREWRNAARDAAWRRYQQAQADAQAAYVAECAQANEAHAQTVTEIDQEYPEVPDAGV